MSAYTNCILVYLFIIFPCNPFILIVDRAEDVTLEMNITEIDATELNKIVIELASRDIAVLIIIILLASIACCILGFKCTQQKCKCKICRSIIKVESEIGCGRFGSVSLFNIYRSTLLLILILI